MFLHGFEQRTLHLGWGTVNLICQNEIGEDRTALYMESLVFLRINLSTHHIGRQQIRSKLNAAIVGADKL